MSNGFLLKCPIDTLATLVIDQRGYVFLWVAEDVD